MPNEASFNMTHFQRHMVEQHARYGSYTLQFTFDVDPTYSDEAFAQRWCTVQASTAALRSSFDVAAKQWVIHSETNVSQWFVVERNALVMENVNLVSRNERSVKFDPSVAPLMRVRVVRSSTRMVCVWTIHHAIIDGVGAGAILQYISHRKMPMWQPDLDRLQSLVSHRERHGTAYATEGASFFHDLLNDVQHCSILPVPFHQVCSTTVPTGSDLQHSTRTHHHNLTPTACDALRFLCSQSSASPSAVLQCIFGVLISLHAPKVANQTQDVIFGEVVSDRAIFSQERYASVVGSFVGTVPVRLSVQHSLRSMIHQAFTQRTTRRPFVLTPLEDIRSQLTNLPAHEPLFSMLFSFTNTRYGWWAQENINVLKFYEHLDVPLALNVEYHNEDRVKVSLDITCEIRFDDEDIRGKADSFLRCFDHCVVIGAQSLDVPVAEFNPTPIEEERRIWEELNTPKALRHHVETDVTLHHLFSKHARRTPEQVAVIDSAGGAKLTYAELHYQSDRVAAAILRVRHHDTSADGKRQFIAICCRRGVESIVAILAVLKTSEAYIPIDFSFPTHRVQYMLEDANVSLVLADSRGEELVRAASKTVVVLRVDERIADDVQESENADMNVSEHERQNDLPAYAIFTSGSTGAPKACVVTHRSVIALVTDPTFDVPIHAEDRVSQFATLSFDDSVWEVWTALLHGATIVIIDKEIMLDPLRLEQCVRDHRVTICNVSTSLFNVLASTTPRVFGGMRLVVFGGEAGKTALVRRVLECDNPPGKLINAYGLTECTVNSTWALMSSDLMNHCRDSPIPIGRALGATWVTVVYPGTFTSCPEGVPGELLVGGDEKLALGYWNRADLTANRFVDVPEGMRNRIAPIFEHSGSVLPRRVYRTGDVVIFDPMCGLLFVGRLDAQIKYDGYRIELAEVESALLDDPGVRGCAVTLHNEKLAAYVVTDDDLVAVRRGLIARLPPFMVPHRLIGVKHIPLTMNLKVDWKVLAEFYEASTREQREIPVQVQDARHVVSAGNDLLAQRICSCMNTVFPDQRALSPHDDITFFLRSIDVPLLLQQLYTQLNIKVSPRDLWSLRTPKAIAAHFVSVAQRDTAVANLPRAVPVSPHDNVFEASPMQMSLWLSDMEGVSDSAYTMPHAWQVKLDPGLGVNQARQKFRVAVRTIVQKHDILRSIFFLDDASGALCQKVCEVDIVPRELEVETSTDAHFALRRFASLRLTLQESARTHTPLVRFLFVACVSDRTELGQVVFIGINAHHILLDGWSFDLLVREISQLTAVNDNPRTAELGYDQALGQYADYSYWWRCRRNEQHPLMETCLHHWTNLLQDCWMTPPLPRAIANACCRTNVVKVRIDADVVRGLRAVAHSADATLGSTMLALYAWVVRRHAGVLVEGRDIPIGCLNPNRYVAGTHEMLGLFIIPFPVVIPLTHATFREAIQSAQRQIWEAAQHAVPFDVLVRHVNPPRGSFHPIFQTFFVFQELNGEPPSFFSSAMSPIALDITSTPKFDVLLEVVELPTGELTCDFHASSAVDHAACASLVQQFQNALQITSSSDRMLLAEPVSKISLMTADEQRVLIAGVNSKALETLAGETTRGADYELLLHDSVTAFAHTAPEKVAIIENATNARVTYAELDNQSTKVAMALTHQVVGSGPVEGGGQRIVGLCMHRGAKFIIAIFAILKTSAAYLSIDLSFPTQRVQFMLEDAKVCLVITDEDGEKRIRAANAEIHIVRWDELANNTQSNAQIDTPLMRTLDRVAYAMYTSGSTGSPKACLVTHRCVRALLLDEDVACVEPHDVVAVTSSFNFDISVYEVFVALTNGATLVVIERDVLVQPAQFALVLDRRKITVSLLATSIFNAIAKEVPHAFQHLKLVHFGGEPANLSAIRAVLLAGRPGRMFNSYGPTESTVMVSCMKCDDDFFRYSSNQSVPIGRPLAGAFLYVVDAETGHLCPPGVRGELIIGGPQVIQRYLNRDVETQRAFVHDSFVSRCGVPSIMCQAKKEGWSIYRTGDIGYYIVSGSSLPSALAWQQGGGTNIQLCVEGRLDSQVKINSTRIELGEVEAALRRHGDVHDCVVVKSKSDTEELLVAYVVHKNDLANIRQHLKDILPSYCVPFLVSLAALPRNTSDKVDKSRLPPPRKSDVALSAPHRNNMDDVRASSTIGQDAVSVREAVLAVWSELLGIASEKLPEDVSFFDLGGDSLKIGRMATKLQAYDCGSQISVGILFKYVTINALISYLRSADVRPTFSPLPSQSAGKCNIVIAGCALRLPRCDGLAEVLATFDGDRDCISNLSDQDLRLAGVRGAAATGAFVARKGVFEKAEYFDRFYFGLSHNDAIFMDPQQRWLLQLSIEALEKSCIVPKTVHGDIGMFFSVSESRYHEHHNLPQTCFNGDPSVQMASRLGRMPEAALGRLAHLLDLRGPAVVVGAACASGLVAMDLALQSLRAGRCRVALVGAVCIDFPLHTGYVAGGINSRDGQCRALDARATGTVPSQGGAVFVLTSEDMVRDAKLPHLATVRATFTNNDGSQKMSYTAPSGAQLEQALHRMLRDSWSQVRYIEMHGSGTLLGDAAELTSLSNVLQQLGSEPKPCGSAKATFGHCGPVSGLVGIARALLALQHQAALPTKHFTRLNESVPEDVRHLLQPHSEGMRPWQGAEEADQVLVNSFGQSGINSFALLEAPCVDALGYQRKVPNAETLKTIGSPSLWAVFPLSAPTRSALVVLCMRVAEWLRFNQEVDLQRVARTLQSGRRDTLFRTFASGNDVTAIVSDLENKGTEQTVVKQLGTNPSFVCIFTGHTGKTVQSAIKRAFDLCCGSPIVARSIAECVENGLLEGIDISWMRTQDAAPLELTEAEKQLVIFAIGYAEARFYIHHGYSLTAVLGHSLGEVTAAVVAGAITVSEACRIIAWRCEILGKAKAGRTIVVRLAPDQAQKLAHRHNVHVAAINSSSQVVLSGLDCAVRDLEKEMQALGHVSKVVDENFAFHCKEIKITRPVPHVEVALTRTAFFPATRTSAAPFSAVYWTQQLTETIDFQQALRAVHDQHGQSIVIVQCGMCDLKSVIQSEIPSAFAFPPLVTIEARQHIAVQQRIGDLFCCGVAPSWSTLHDKLVPFLGDLPTYPFELSLCTPQTSELSPAQKLAEFAREHIFQQLEGCASIGYAKLEANAMMAETATAGNTDAATSGVYPLGCLSRLLTLGLVGHVARRLNDTIVNVLSRKVAEFVPPNVARVLPKEFADMRLIHLCSSSSGLPFYPETPSHLKKHEATELVCRMSVRQIFQQLPRTKLRYAPGSSTSYSVMGVGLLGICLSVLLQEPFEDLLQEFVQEVGMHHTHTRSPIPDVWACATGLRSAAGVFSTMDDLLQLARVILQAHAHPLASPQDCMLPFMFRADSDERWWYAGSTTVSSSWFCVDLKHQCAVVLLAHVAAPPHHITSLGQRTLDWVCHVSETPSFITPDIVKLWGDKVVPRATLLCHGDYFLRAHDGQHVPVSLSIQPPTPADSPQADAAHGVETTDDVPDISPASRPSARAEKNSDGDMASRICRILSDLVVAHGEIDGITQTTRFDDLGLDSMNSLIFAVSVERDIGKTISANVVHEFDTVGDLVASLQEKPHKSTRSVDSLLQDAYQKIDQIRQCKSSDKRSADGILLTGSSGYLGVHVLHALLRHCAKRTIYCLVLREQDLWNRVSSVLGAPAAADIYATHRIECVTGDLTKPKLGLSEKRWETLAAHVSCIINTAGRHEWVLSVEDTFEVNVGGVVRLVELATARWPAAALHHVSTVGVLQSTLQSPTGGINEAQWPKNIDSLSFGLLQGKALAELALRRAQEVCPITILRPEPVYWIGSAEAAEGGGRPIAWRFWERFITGIARLGVVSGDGTCPGWTPIDFVANVVTRLALAPPVLSDARVFHLTCPHALLPMTSFCALLQESGVIVRRVSTSEFEKILTTVRDNHPSNPLAPLLEFYSPEILSKNYYGRNDCSRLTSAMQKLNVELTQLCPHMDHCIPPLIRQLARMGVLTRDSSLPPIVKTKSVRNSPMERLLAPFFQSVVITLDFPLAVCIGPVTSAGGGDLKALLRVHGDTLRQVINTIGGVLLRNSHAYSHEEVDDVVNGLGFADKYEGGIAPRTPVTSTLWTSTDAPRQVSIPLHCEKAYAPLPPHYIVFYCETPATQGGQTPVADTERVASALDESTLEHFRRRGLTYTIRAPPKDASKKVFGLSWNSMFNTDNTSDVDAILDQRTNYLRTHEGVVADKARHEWMENGTLLMQYTTSATWWDDAGRERWSNHAHIFHPSGHFELDPSVSKPETASAVYRRNQDPGAYPKFVTHADGTELDDVMLTDIRRAWRTCEMATPWRAGDIMILNNRLVAHGRRPFEGNRRVLVALRNDIRT